jgi:hypothetical protein
VDATTRKLVERIKVLEYEKWRAEAEIESIKVALRAAGVKLESIEKQVFIHEPRYVSLQMFEGFSLRESCEEILQHHPGQWFSKSDIEYLIVRGGYKFNTDDSKNSVAVTLQRMKEDGRCEVERARGARGNRYRWRMEEPADVGSTRRRG